MSWNTAPPVRAPRYRDGAWTFSDRRTPEETAIAIVIDGGAEAVMMGTPADLEDFAYGFCFTEGIVRDPSLIRRVEIVQEKLGVELRLWLEPDAGRALQKRRRWRMGPTGCGLCGLDSLEEALRPLPAIRSEIQLPPETILAAMRALGAAQPLHQATRAVHAAAFFTVAEGLVAVREDVGRHNALDKVAGALVRSGKLAEDGVLLMTSRVSIELVQKATALGAPILAAVSAPTAQALRSAEEAGLCVCGIVRDDGFEVFTHPERILGASRDGD